jgi:signal recognition particle subunit SRP54
MIPGMSEMMGGNEDEAAKRMKRVAFIFDSMTAEELDSDGSLFRDAPPPATSVASTSKTPAPAPRTEHGKEKAVDPEAEMAPREPNKRVLRVARGSGTSVNEVEELLAQHQMFSGMVKKAGGKSGWYVASRLGDLLSAR